MEQVTTQTAVVTHTFMMKLKA